ncbi:perforin-1-like isoform X1 [Tachysurus ichikawai]
MLKTLLIWAVFAASLPPPSTQSCFNASESQCRDVDFTPGSDLAGEGFDITTMERKGAFVLDMSTWLKKDKSCTLCKNPYMEGQTQKLPVSVVIGGYTQSVDLLFSSNNDPNAYKEWLASLPAHPDIIFYSLESIHNLLPAKTQAKAHLRNAIKDYILQRGLLKNCTSPCNIGVKTNSKEPCKCSCVNNPQLSINCCPAHKGSAEVKVTVIKATGLYGDFWDATDGFVKLSLNNRFRDKTGTILNNNSPTWNTDFHLGPEDLTRSITLKLEVFDEDRSSEEQLGACNLHLKSGEVKEVCALNHGLLYYKVQVTCIFGLIGPSCSKLKPSPMDAQLEKVYVSRNAHPIPTGMLLKMGVLLDERIPRFNQSHIRKDTGFEL